MSELVSRGHDCIVCARNYFGRPKDEVRGRVRLHRSPTVSRGLPAVNSLLYLSDGLAWLARNRHRFDVVLCQQMYGAAMLGLLARRLLGKPVVVRVTSSGEFSEIENVRRLPLAGLRFRLLRGVDAWVALTEEMKNEVCGLGVPRDRVTVIPNATDLPDGVAYDPRVRARHRERLKLGDGPLAVYSGRLSEEKGLDVLLHAWTRLQRDHPGASLCILGAGGSYRNVEPALRSLRAELELEPVVRMPGVVTNVVEHLLASDMFVLPTRTEGMSNALVEAMAAGAAVVTTDIPANRALIEHGVHGLLVPVGDARALAAAMGRVLSEPGLGRRLGEAAREKAERDLSIGTMTARYVGVFEGVLNRGAPVS